MVVVRGYVGFSTLTSTKDFATALAPLAIIRKMLVPDDIRLIILAYKLFHQLSENSADVPLLHYFYFMQGFSTVQLLRYDFMDMMDIENIDDAIN